MDTRREMMGGALMSKGKIDTNNYLTIEALEDGLTASLSVNSCEYSIDGSEDWKTLSANTATESINTGHTLSFRGNLTPTVSGIGTFTISKQCNLKGNCMSMLFGDEAANNYSLSGKNYAFSRLFYNCRNITSVSKQFLPATTLSMNCYYSMFCNCKNLISGPNLPSVTLAVDCYDYMFYGTKVLPDCSNIDFTSSTVVQSRGLTGLFAGTKVTDSDLFNILPINSDGKYCLPVTKLGAHCYTRMFYECKSLITAPKLPATTLKTSCYNDMFDYCSSLIVPPELSATTLANGCYEGMFSNCTSLTTAPELPATTLVDYCYMQMFANCTKLNYIKMMATGGLSSTSCLTQWTLSVASTGTFIKHQNMTGLSTGVNGIPSGWTIQNE